MFLSTSVLNLQVYGVMKMSDAVIFNVKAEETERNLTYCGLLTLLVMVVEAQAPVQEGI